MERFNHRMFTLARESRGLTQSELARRLRVSQGRVSKVEHGLLEVSEDFLDEISKSLGYPKSFFFQVDALHGLPFRKYHRKKKSVGKRELAEVDARINILRMQVERLLKSVDIQPRVRIPQMDVDEFDGDAAEVARAVRSGWLMPRGPIENLVETLEDAGAIVIPFDFKVASIDAIGIRFPARPEFPPLFFVSKTIPGDRMRFTLAHELGHIVMHEFPSAEMECEADIFAGEFLMPASDIAPYLTNVSLESLVKLKPYWKTSVASLIERAFSIGAVSESKRKWLHMRMSQMGYRKSEPVAIPREEPSVLREVVDTHLNDLSYSVADLARALHANEAEFQRLHLPERGLHVLTGGRS